MVCSPILLAASVAVAFPRPGMTLPAVSRVYVIGSASADVTNVVVAGVPVAPYRTGAWATRVPVTGGVNVLKIAWFARTGEAGTNELAVTVPPQTKTYSKLSYAEDRPNPAQAKEPNETRIYLDPGHGGSDTGAVSPHGWFEKDANLALARETAARLRVRGYRVQLTRENDTALELYERARAAHREDADAFVSIHHNAPAADADPLVRYSGVYVWNDLGTPLARAIAARLGKTHEGVFASKGALKANFAVTRSPEIPSCLVEADFITAPAGEEDIFDPTVCAARAEAIAAGIDDWWRARNAALKGEAEAK